VHTTISSTTRSNLRGAWLLAIFWNLVSAPILVFVPPELERNPVAAIGFIFPAIGVGLLAWAIHTTLRWRRYGSTRFEMAAPAAAGGACRGTIHTRFPTDHTRSIRVTLKLTCLQRTITGSGKHRNVRESILWQEEAAVPDGHVSFGPQGAFFPVQFALPADARATTASKGSAGIFWVLAAEASLPGVDFHEDFDIPVEGPAASNASSEPTFAEQFTSRVEPVSPADLAAAGIRVQPTETGMEYYFGPARNVSFGLGVTIFTLIWTGALALQFVLDIPWIFIIVTGLVELLLLLIVADVWFGTTTVTIGGGVVRRRHALLGMGGTKVIPAGSGVNSIDPILEARASKGQRRYIVSNAPSIEKVDVNAVGPSVTYTVPNGTVYTVVIVD
jgi:hypothetical protein